MQLKNLPSDIKFEYGMEPVLDNKHLTSLCDFIRKENKLEVGLNVTLEKNLRIHLKGTLLSWKIDKDSSELVPKSYRYYHNSMAKVLLDSGEVVEYPFSMIMVDKSLLK